MTTINMNVNPAALRVEGLRKRYGAREVLSGIDLAIDPGTALGLAGTNGAGKTTLIKCILDLCSSDTGTVNIFGAPSRETSARTRLAYLPERFLPPHALSAREFLRMMLALAGRPFEDGKVCEMLARLEFDVAALDLPVRRLSSGTMQKLGLSACLLSDRDLYILDEPLTGLDPAARAAVKNVLREIAGRGKTLMLTGHVLADMEDLCTGIAVLDRGRIRFCGSPDELRVGFSETDLERAFLRCVRAG